MLRSTEDKRKIFKELHETGCFVIPNPWDEGSARLLQHMGYSALATSSAAFAFTLGRPDSVKALPLDLVLEHIRTLVECTELPVNADFQNGYADSPEEVAHNVRLCVETGVAGLSIEDATGIDDGEPIYPFDLAVERVKAAREAIDKSGANVFFTARCECFLVGQRDIDEVIRRLKAYSEAGADCLYAPGLTSKEHIEAVVKAVAPKPVNVVIGSKSEFTIKDLASLGVRRVSVGSGLARTAWGAFIRAAKLLKDEGSFEGLAGAATIPDMNGIFTTANMK